MSNVMDGGFLRDSSTHALVVTSAEAVSVLSFGADPTGTVDSRPALLAAHQAAEALGSATILYPPGTYLLDSTGPIPLTPRSGGGWLRIAGYGATIKIGANMPAASRGFLKSGRTADDQTLSQVIVEGFDIDGNKSSALSSEGLRGGNIFATTNASSGGRLNFADLIFRDIHSYGLSSPTTYNAGTGTFNNQTHLYVACYHTTQSEAQNTIKRIRVENVRMEAGVQGVFVGGTVASGTGCEVYYDDIVFRDSVHDFTATHTSSTGSNFQVGSHAFGDRVVMERCEGRYGNDSSFETNAGQHVTYRGCVTRDCRSQGFYARDFHAAQSAKAKRWAVEDCKAIYANVAPNNVTDGTGYDCRGIQIGAATTDAWGSVVIRNYNYELTASTAYDGPSAANSNTHQGHAIYMRGATSKVLRLENVHVRETNLAISNGTRGGTYSPVSIRPQTDSDKMLLVVNGLHFVQAGTIVSMTNTFTYDPLYVGGDPTGGTADVTLDVSGVDFNHGLASNASYGVILMTLGVTSGVTNKLRGVVRDVYVISQVATSGGVLGIQVGASDRCTVDKHLVLERCDFTNNVSANNEITLSGTTTAGTPSNLASVIRRDCTLRTSSTLNGAAPIAVSLQGTVNTTNASNSATSAAGAIYQVGQAITGTGIPANTFIGTVSGSTLTLTTSNLVTASNATATNTGTTVTMDRYQNLDSVREEFRITGGTVTDISHSRDGVTFGTIAAATGERVMLEPGHVVKLTKSAEPTMTKTLQR